MPVFGAIPRIVAAYEQRKGRGGKATTLLSTPASFHAHASHRHEAARVAGVLCDSPRPAFPVFAVFGSPSAFRCFVFVLSFCLHFPSLLLIFVPAGVFGGSAVAHSGVSKIKMLRWLLLLVSLSATVHAQTITIDQCTDGFDFNFNGRTSDTCWESQPASNPTGGYGFTRCGAHCVFVGFRRTVYPPLLCVSFYPRLCVCVCVRTCLYCASVLTVPTLLR